MLFQSLFGNHIAYINWSSSSDIGDNVGSISLFTLRPQLSCISVITLPRAVSHVAFSLTAGFLIAASPTPSGTLLSYHHLDRAGNATQVGEEAIAGVCSGLAITTRDVPRPESLLLCVVGTSKLLLVYRVSRDGASSLVHRLTADNSPLNQQCVSKPAAAGSPPLLAYQISPGVLSVVDITNARSCLLVRAHKTNCARVAISPSGDTICSISEHGTVLRIFCVPSGEALPPLRRGSRPASATCLTYSVDGSVVALGSLAGSVHLARVSPKGETRSSPRRAGVLCETAAGVAGAVVVGGAGSASLEVFALAPQGKEIKQFLVPMRNIDGLGTVLKCVTSFNLSAVRGHQEWKEDD